MRRVVVITGGTAGVGRATAIRFAREGAAVAVLARGEDRFAPTIADLEAAGGQGLAIQCDVSVAAQVEAAAARVEEELGPIDVWINNAMVTAVGPIGEILPEELQRITDVCYHGTVWGTRAALARMRTRNRGTIIQVGSALAYRSIPLQSAYCGAKHAIHGFTDSVRSEVLHDELSIDLCMVQLPAVNTPQFGWCVNRMDRAPQPMPPIFQPEIIAEALHRVSLHPRREVYLGWPAIEAILGNGWFPGLADRYLAHAGYEGQLTDQPNRNPPSNLFTPVPGDRGAHGAFDRRARSTDLISRVATVVGGVGVRAAVASALLVSGLVVFSAISRRRARRSAPALT